MAQRSDSELLKIINELRNDYQPEAIEAAEVELISRGLNDEQIQNAKKEIEFQDKITSEKSNIKLGYGWKAFAFIFPGLLLIIFSGTLKADGFDRKARELTGWTLFGFGFYFGLVFLMIIISQILS